MAWKQPTVLRCTAAAVLLPVLSLVACRGAEKNTNDGQSDSASVDKVPITTSSKTALESYLQGRDLAERARGAEARPYFEQAVAEDSEFALAHLALANSAPSAQEFFDSIGRAVELAEEVSKGERLMILGQDAGVRGDPATQKNLYAQLVELFPGDERAHMLLGNFHFGRQEYERAIKQYQLATEANADYSTAYNILGYAYRSTGDYEQAEEAFKRYVQLIPDEPNPYDSYAELLFKTGRFEESIANYRKALEINPEFVFSFVGIGNNQILQGELEQARSTFETLYDNARNDGERRTAHFWSAASYVHEGEYRKAMESCRRMLEVAEAKGDWAAATGDLTLIAGLQLEARDAAGARATFEQALETIERADVNEDVKDAVRRNHAYNLARIAVAQDDLVAAARETETYAEQVATRNIPGEVRQLRELQGRIALLEKDWETALWHLGEANQQDPRILLYMARASLGAGDEARARELATQAAQFNQLSMNFALARPRAQALLAAL